MDETEAPARKPSDWVRLYVLAMGLFTLVFAAAWVKWASDRNAFREANATAAAVFGTARPAGVPLPVGDDRPTTVTGYALGVLKYIVTWKDAKVKPGEGGDIPLQLVKDTASGHGLGIRSTPSPQTQKVTTKDGRKYEEVSATFIFDQTNLRSLADFLYDFERKTTKFRVLDLRWSLKPDKENPVVQGVSYGHLIQQPTVKIGFRRAVMN